MFEFAADRVCRAGEGENLKPLGAVQDPAEVRRYLKHCNIEYDPPPRGPPKLVQDSFEFDQAILLNDYEAVIYTF